MSQGNPSCLRFSLEESVWFQKGQEVSDLISISLDPDILIQENDQYVTIQGALELSGEYKRYESNDLEQEDTFAAPKFIQVVEERDGGVCEFNHFFPVDITIPKNRISSIQDIDVLVESFDYVFPERSCLKLTANLTISGLYEEERQSSVQAETEEVESEPVYYSEEATPEINWNLSTQEDNMNDLNDSVEEQYNDPIFVPFKAEARKQQNETLETERKSEINVEYEDVNHADIQPEISFSAQRGEKSPPSGKELFAMPEMEKSVVQEHEVEVEVEVEVEMEQESSSEESPDHDVKEEATVEKKKKSLFKKKSMTLTEFFARKTEDNVARLKVCIVQSGDTVDIIAERYDIPVHRLLSVNQLETTQDLYEGQVLYIPAAVPAK
ncbi:stage VI sporulation protein D [Bacillus sp. S/N-304-OC-R1]|uniref:stage VI sporulation protein D n=1 Tax=Bacillus sp. S/N-304-OC-R1 TaxID=2758034 RepID=UPI001C8DB194|nr:stage VI sporulation protein D [Bacillus sp. S/N-304-OC-R1]MBY0123976.1 stage VI sporulation protein D [Bacillus sp. S/N-304-OC-R1]